MNNYRYVLTLDRTRENLEYYFCAENDEYAKKHFLLEVYKFIKHEDVDMNRVHMYSEGSKITCTEADGQTRVFLATLHYVPSKAKRVDSDYYDQEAVDLKIRKLRRMFSEGSNTNCKAVV